MRLYSLVLLTSTAVPTCIFFSASGVVCSSLRKANLTTSVPLLVDVPDGAPVLKLVKAGSDDNNEERMNPPTQLIADAGLLSARDIKDIMVAKFAKHAGVKLTSAGWKRPVDESEEFVERLTKLTSQQHTAKIESMLRAPEEKQAMDHLEDLAAISEEMYVKELRSDIETWMKGKPSEDLVNVLTVNGFFERFIGEKVEALRRYMGNKHIMELLNTLLVGFGGVDKFAPMLSIAKLSAFTGETAAAIQKVLLTHWQNNGFSVKTVIGFLKLEGKHLTYDTLETVVEYVLLLHPKMGPDEATSVTLRYILDMYGESAVAQGVFGGKSTVQSAKWYLRGRYKDKSIALENEEHNKLADAFETMLLQKMLNNEWFPSHVEANPFGLLEDDAKKLSDDYRKFFNSKNFLSLRPPGS